MRKSVEEIKSLLRDTNDSFVSIAEQSQVSRKTVYNINMGKTHFSADELYPIRASGARLGELRNRMVIPVREAVPIPQIISPQLIDYIGFLSLLKADIGCLLVFKDVYYESLKEIFGRELSDKDILSIIYLRPSKPRPLVKLIDAYDNPKVGLINLDYWVSKGLISARERELIVELL